MTVAHEPPDLQLVPWPPYSMSYPSQRNLICRCGS